MLRRWREPTVIALAPEEVSLRAPGTSTRSMQLASSMAAGPAWETLPGELEQLAAGLDIRSVRFILSNCLVRYAALPWQEGVLSGQDWQALAEHHMRKLYSGSVDSWEVRAALQGYGEPVVACAIDRTLLSRLQEIAAGQRWEIHGIEPALMSVFNHHRRTLGTDHWLLLAEPQRLLLAEVAAGQWQHFSVASPPAGQEQGECLALMERAIRLHGSPQPAPMLCFGPASLLPASAPPGIKLVRLPQPATGQHSTSTAMLAGL